MALAEIKRLVAEGKYRYSYKVRTFIEEGLFGEEDLVQCILSARKFPSESATN